MTKIQKAFQSVLSMILVVALLAGYTCIGTAAAKADDFTKTDYNKLAQILKRNGVKLHEREL